jgi:D-alanyl-D-alanine carboxypeptidase (penicillin-binding protein 5/6)
MTIRSSILALFVLLVSLPGTAAPLQMPTPEPPHFNASSFILMDYDSGQIIAERNAREPVDPASITKLMTAYIVFSELQQGKIGLNDMVPVSTKAWKAEGSRMFIKAGDQVRLEDLLRGTIIQSGNDSSIALAEHLAGGENTFASWMNQHAELLSMTDTHYTNATGLTGEDHKSSARDIALLSRALIRQFPDHYALYSEKEFTYGGITQPNRNKLLWRDPSVDGMKTGYTEAAGYCLVASAQRDGMRLISVVLGTPSTSARVQSSESLLNYGFRFFETIKVASEGEALATAKIWKAQSPELELGAAQSVYVTIPRGRSADLSLYPHMEQRLMAPITRNDSLGTVDIALADQTLRSVPLVALQDMPLGSFWQRVRDSMWLFVKR